MSDFKPELSAAQIKANFADIAPAFHAQEAAIEASRCLFCYDAPCIKACPTKINIPQFIQQIATGDVTGSAKTIFTENIFGGTCGRVCPTSVLCEGACVYNEMNKKPIEIGRLQRYSTDHAIEHNIQFWTRSQSSGPKLSGHRVAIVGAGPAGLTCAFELTKLGHGCVVFEAAPRPGGLNTYGVAGYKIDTEFALREVEYVKQIGIEVRLNAPVGQKPTVLELLNDFDAVFISVGMGSTAALSIPGEDLEGCLEALEFIRPTRDPKLQGIKIGSRVVVIGGGNTAIDVATAAVRLGAKHVEIVYRRTVSQMSAFKYEYELAKADGVAFTWLTAPTKILGAKGRVSGVECHRLELSPSADGRGMLRAVPDSKYVIPCDMVIKALGQESLRALLINIPGLKLSGDGFVDVDRQTGATSVAKLFAGGDCAIVGEVVDAVQHGKIAAKGIDRYLKQ